MRIVFLDIDGVLNSRAWFVKQPVTLAETCEFDQFDKHLDPDAIAQLNRITRETGAKIVVSSTWRLIHKLPELRTGLKRRGVDALIISTTPCDRNDRGVQIRMWLDKHRDIYPVESFVVLDDDSKDIPPVQHRLVLTDSDRGLVRDDADLAIAMLRRASRE